MTNIATLPLDDLIIDGQRVPASDGGQIDIIFGCETKVVPPPA